jgi:transglutaminase-like putative cysteine protease
MSLSWSIPRNCLAWILIAQVALIIPHVSRLPWWIVLVYICCAVWRIMVFRGQWSFPPSIIKVIFCFLCFAGIYSSYGTPLGIEPTVALLFTGFSLKLLEVRTKRDVYIIVFLAYFVALTEFLFDQSFLIAAFIFFSLLIITTALVALHQQGYNRFDLISLKKTGWLFFQALPLMIVLFIIFPRFEPLWKVPLPAHQAKTGVSNSMSPGDISSLGNSSELAFRAVFDEEVPAKEKLYWRGLVMSEFDGRTWRQGRRQKSSFNERQKQSILRSLNNPIQYQIIQEASHQPWLFSLKLAFSYDQNIQILNDFRLSYEGDIHSRIQYAVISDLDAPLEIEISERVRRVETRLPDSGNPLAREFAKELYQLAGSDFDFIQSLLSNFRQNNFIYTLNPPLLGENSVDEFLFDTLRGFCGHYASSFVFMARAVGIPARVVTGYQGGEINPITGTVLVHQFDAHAWAEVWLKDKGWIRIDPTAAVSPDRIEFGLERALAEEGSFLSDSVLSPIRYRNVAWLNNLRLQMDAFSYYWSSWVLQYKGRKQLDVMKYIMGEVTPWRVAGFLLLIGGFVLSMIAFNLLKGRRKPKAPLEVRIYLQICDRLEQKGFKRNSYEGPVAFARKVAEIKPAWKKDLLAATRAFVTLTYEQLPPDQHAAVLKQLKSDASQLKRILSL